MLAVLTLTHQKNQQGRKAGTAGLAGGIADIVRDGLVAAETQIPIEIRIHRYTRP